MQTIGNLRDRNVPMQFLGRPKPLQHHERLQTGEPHNIIRNQPFPEACGENPIRNAQQQFLPEHLAALSGTQACPSMLSRIADALDWEANPRERNLNFVPGNSGQVFRYRKIEVQLPKAFHDFNRRPRKMPLPIPEREQRTFSLQGGSLVFTCILGLLAAMSRADFAPKARIKKPASATPIVLDMPTKLHMCCEVLQTGLTLQAL